MEISNCNTLDILGEIAYQPLRPASAPLKLRTRRRRRHSVSELGSFSRSSYPPNQEAPASHWTILYRARRLRKRVPSLHVSRSGSRRAPNISKRFEVSKYVSSGAPSIARRPTLRRSPTRWSTRTDDRHAKSLRLRLRRRRRHVHIILYHIQPIYNLSMPIPEMQDRALLEIFRMVYN